MFRNEINLVIIEDRRNKQEEINYKDCVRTFLSLFMWIPSFFYFIPLRCTPDRSFAYRFRGFMNLHAGRRIRFYRVLTMVYNTELLGFRTLPIVRILNN
jgi:hypothetical protein